MRDVIGSRRLYSIRSRAVSVCSVSLWWVRSRTGQRWPRRTEAIVEQIAPLSPPKTRATFKPDLFRRGLVAPDSLVRRIAALSAGRIGDFRATPLVVPLLTIPIPPCG